MSTRDAGSAVKRADINAIQVGDTASCEFVITEQDVDAFATLSLDTNPLHMDARVAEEYGFPKRVAHGMLALSSISRLIGTELPGPGALCVSQVYQYVAPVLVGDRLVACVTVEQVSNATSMVKLKAQVVNAETGSTVLSGTARVKVPERVKTVAEESGQTRVAVVTGSSRGLGRAIALALAATTKVVVHYNRNGEAAKSVVDDIVRRSGFAVACQADLRTSAGCEQLFERASEAFSRVDILVNNASPPVVRKPVLEAEWSDFECYLSLHVQSAFRLTQLAVPGMQARRFGRIVNVLCSSAQGVPSPRLGPYVTAKSALAGLSRVLAVELGPLGITVNTVAPSLLVTHHSSAPADRARQLAASQSPMRRQVALEDVAQATCFLVSDAAGFITGVTLPVAGGEMM